MNVTNSKMLQIRKNVVWYETAHIANKWKIWQLMVNFIAVIPVHIQSPRLFWARIMLKWANKYLGIQRLQSRSVYGDSNSFSMVVLGKKMNCQKVAPFLWNLPTFKKRTHQFWDSKVSGAFPGGLWAKVLLSKCLLQSSSRPTPKFLSKFFNSDQNERQIPKIVHGNL